MARRTPRADARSAARLGAVQALYQHEMEGAAVAAILAEFHGHRLGGDIEDETLIAADARFFDDLVCGVNARSAEIDAIIVAHLAPGWGLARLDRTSRAMLRAATYELLARPDVPVGAVVDEYVEIAHAFVDERQAGFINGLLDAVARKVRV